MPLIEHLLPGVARRPAPPDGHEPDEQPLSPTALQADLAAAIEALEATVGVNSSAVMTTPDDLLKSTAPVQPAWAFTG
jgi:hypothetical protein